jgi:hypothetical protein
LRLGPRGTERSARSPMTPTASSARACPARRLGPSRPSGSTRVGSNWCLARHGRVAPRLRVSYTPAGGCVSQRPVQPSAPRTKPRAMIEPCADPGTVPTPTPSCSTRRSARTQATLVLTPRDRPCTAPGAQPGPTGQKAPRRSRRLMSSPLRRVRRRLLTDVFPGEIGAHTANVPEPPPSDGLRHCDRRSSFDDKHAVGPRKLALNIRRTKGSRLLSPATELKGALQRSGGFRCPVGREGSGVH